MEPGHRSLATMALALLTSLLLLLWLPLLSRIRGRWWMTAGILVILGVLASMFRFEQFSGDFIPRVTWRSQRDAHERLSLETPKATADGAPPAIELAPAEDDYPQFLGPNRRGELPGPRLARDWSAQPPKPVWRRPIGAGWSAFAIVGDYAFTQELRGQQELVTCYDRHTGAPEWTYIDPLTTRPYDSVIAGDGPRGTPTVVDGRVYTVGSTGVLNCLDAATGEHIWSHDVLAEHQATNPVWGISCSPLVLDDRVIVTGGGGRGPALVAYDRDTGQQLYAAGEAVNNDSYCSPSLATLCGVEQILILNDTRVASHDPADGNLLWSYPWKGGSPNVTQPVALPDDRVFVSAGYGKGCVLLQLSKEAEGAFTVDEVWPLNRNLKTKFTNVVTHNGFVYGLDEGILACVDLADGKRRWKGGRYGHGQILLVGDLILVQVEEGPVALVEATPDEFRELTTFPALSNKTWNNPVLVGDLLYVRNHEEAACYELPLE
jgi:outer membrane protein assembly factor BamB